ncbi:Putative ribonuclease H protein At1g65750 [Linum perenne]
MTDLWKARNEWIFIGKEQTPVLVAAKSLSWTETIRSAMTCDRGVDGLQPSRTNVDIGWEKGPTGLVVLNTDGSVLTHSNSAAAGGLIQNEFGRCLNAFSINLGRCSITRAEFRGAMVGLEIAWDTEFRKVVARVDSLAVLNLTNSEEVPTHQHSGEIITL